MARRLWMESRHDSKGGGWRPCSIRYNETVSRTLPSVCNSLGEGRVQGSKHSRLLPRWKRSKLVVTLSRERAGCTRVFCAINRANEYIPSIGGWRVRGFGCELLTSAMITDGDEGWFLDRELNTTCLKFSLLSWESFTSDINIHNFHRVKVIK